MGDTLPEPWLRGPLEHVPRVVMPVFFSFAQVREDLRKHAQGLDRDQVWRREGDLPPLGFHLKHIAGSVDRLTTYLSGGQLSREQLEFLKHEQREDAGLNELLAAIDASLSRSEERLLAVDSQALFEARTVGRQQLPTTVIGLIVHLAEHTQRHLGQAITTIQILRH